MTCSFAWDEAGLPAWGTAPRGGFWVALEQNGPWGGRAFTQSRLDPAIGAAIEAEVLAAGGRPLLIRRPASHADHADHPRRRVFVAGGLAGTPWLLGGSVGEPEEVLGLPFELFAEGDPDVLAREIDWLERLDGGILLVCANGKRDLCCALRGRPIALELERQHPGRVWECTHTGGHRFAPTGVVLPSGQSLARLTPEVASAALRAAEAGLLASETFGPWHDRGRGHLEPVRAVAEAFVRELTDEHVPDALSVSVERPAPASPALDGGSAGRARRNPEGGEFVVVTHRDGRRWALRLTQQAHGDLPESCGKAAVAAKSWMVEPVG
jgi:sucrase/ferredoxin-like protein